MDKDTQTSLGVNEITMSDLPFHLEIALKTKNSLFIHGSPGLGKSKLVHDFCKKKHEEGIFKSPEPIELRLAQHDVTDFKFPLIDRETKTLEWIVANVFPQEKRDGPNGVLFLDELTSAPPLIQTLAYALLLDHKIPSTSYRLPKGWVVIAAGNKENDQAVVHKLSSALCNRVNHLYVRPDWHAFAEWAAQNGIEPEVLSFLKTNHAEHLYNYVPGQKAYPSPRTWEKTSDAIKVLKLIKAESHKIREQLISWLGPKTGSSFSAYVEQCKDLPSPEDVLLKKVKFPEQIDKMFLLGQNLATVVQDNPKKWCKPYMELLLNEFHEDVAIDSLRRVLSSVNNNGNVLNAFKQESVLFKKVATKFRPGLQKLEL